MGIVGINTYIVTHVFGGAHYIYTRFFRYKNGDLDALYELNMKNRFILHIVRMHSARGLSRHHIVMHGCPSAVREYLC